MQVAYRLEALADLNNHFSYISQENPEAAARVVSKIRQTIRRLARFPYSARKGIEPGTYELVIPRLPYIVVYRVHSFVEILAVFHTATDTPRS